MKHCAACGGKIKEDVQFCPHCGAKISDAEEIRDYWAETLCAPQNDAEDEEIDWTEEIDDEDFPGINEDIVPEMLEARPPVKSRRPFIWGSICIFLVLTVILLCFCLPFKENESPMPGAGKYLGCTGTSEDLTITNENDYIELFSDGSFKMKLLDETMKGRWLLEGNKFLGMMDHRNIEGTLQDGVLIFLYSDIEFLFARPDRKASLLKEKEVLNPTVPTEQEAFAFWPGDYYGCLILSSCEGDFTGYEGVILDVCGEIQSEEEGLGSIALWNEENQPGDRFCMGDVLFTEGTGIQGKMILRWGYFFDMELKAGEWAVDPGKSPYSQFPNLLYIKSRYMEPQNPGNTFQYEVILRPWGQSWQDILEDPQESGILPPGYESFYLPLKNAGKNMPDHF